METHAFIHISGIPINGLIARNSDCVAYELLKMQRNMRMCVCQNQCFFHLSPCKVFGKQIKEEQKTEKKKKYDFP